MTLGDELAWGFDVVEVVKELGEDDADRRAGHGQLLFDALEARRRGEVGHSTEWIDGPDVIDAHGGVVVDALLHVAEGVVAGEDFYAEERRGVDDGVGGVGAAEDGEIGDAEARGGDLNALLG